MINDNFQQNYLDSILSGDKNRCSAIVSDYLSENPSITDLYEIIIKKSLYEVGKLWETNKISVASEHLATAITEGILNELFEKIIQEKKVNRKVVLTCVESELHQVGIKMVADVFEMNGWDSYFLGTGIPVNELIRYLEEVQPDTLAISLSIYFNYMNLIKLISKIQKEFPELLILIGGQAFIHVKKESLIQSKNVFFIPDLYYLIQFLQTLKSKNQNL